VVGCGRAKGGLRGRPVGMRVRSLGEGDIEGLDGWGGGCGVETAVCIHFGGGLDLKEGLGGR
jgi:hypothetical protein